MTFTPGHQPAALLDLLEADIQADAHDLKELGAALERAIADIRHFGQSHHPSHAWEEHWRSLEDILGKIKALAHGIQEALESDDHPRMRQALETREALRAEDERLADELRLIREQLVDMDATGRADWNTLAQVVEDLLDAIHTSVLVMRTKLELAEGRTHEQVRDFVRDVASQLREHPCPASADPRAYELEYLKASIDLAHEKHEALGFPTNIKTLFTWFETPEERVQRKLAFPVD